MESTKSFCGAHTHTHLTADKNEPNSTAIFDNIPFSPYTLYLHAAPCVSQPRAMAAMTIDTPPSHSLQGVWAVLASDDKARARRAVTHHLSARWTLLCAAGAPEACHLFFDSGCQMIHNHRLFIDRFTTFFWYKVFTFAYISRQVICNDFFFLLCEQWGITYVQVCPRARQSQHRKKWNWCSVQW